MHEITGFGIRNMGSSRQAEKLPCIQEWMEQGSVE
jgi:hypothetical protein